MANRTAGTSPGSTRRSTPQVSLRAAIGAAWLAVLVLSGCASPRSEAVATEDSTTSTSTTVTPTTTTTLSPEQQEQKDIAEITAAVIGAYDGQTPIEARMVFVRDGASLVAAVYESRSKLGARAGTISAEIDNVVFESPDKALFDLRILSSGSVIARVRGSAVRVDGIWKVSRATLCGTLGLVPVACPADTTGFAMDETVPAPAGGGGGGGPTGGSGGSAGGGGGPKWTVRLFTNGSPDMQGQRQTAFCPPTVTFTYTATSSGGETVSGSFSSSLNDTVSVALPDGATFFFGYFDSNVNQTPGTCWTRFGGNIMPG